MCFIFMLVDSFNCMAVFVHLCLLMPCSVDYADPLLTYFFINFNRIIGIIIKEIEANIGKNTFLANFRMSALPVLCNKFVELVSTLVMRCSPI